MKKRYVSFSILGALILLFGIGLWVHHLEDQDFYQKGGPGWQMGNNPPEKVDFRPASNPLYKNSCGGCHFPFSPGLLPALSWKLILDRLENHFGEQVSIDPRSREEILNYLMENGADRAGSKKSTKIMNSLNGQIPLRITEIPIMQKKHRGIKPEVLSRKAIGSLSNCVACHTTAERGIFNEDFVKIPD
ncbi:MAG: hypothetical protein A2Y79_02380 [Deltaproteobacteria bacterium RBG_13_43_22]|nr:MAG: hypothetical protein A2Y79_02380 [Deltaproteobacteria bacterium RBG_13_43_22]